MTLIESISGVRGIVGKSLTPDTVVRYGKALADFNNKKPFVVGRDGRITGKIISDILISTLLAKGCDIRDIGIAPTPTVQLETEHSDTGVGVVITASHNSIEWNGLKFLGEDGLFFDDDQNDRLRNLIDAQSDYAAWDKIGNLFSVEGAIDRHIKKALSLPEIDRESIRKRKIRVVADCINASGGVIIPGLLETLGCTATILNGEINGVFAHNPEPIPQHLNDLSSAVKNEKGDLGIAVDPDSDRLVIIDETGMPIGEEYSIATIVDFVLSKIPAQQRNKPVVINLSTTRAVEDIADKYGVSVIRVPVGEINVAKRMRETGGIIGGEGSGGIIHAGAHYGRDAIVGIVLLLQLLTESDKPLSKIKASLPEYHIRKEKITTDKADPELILQEFKGKIKGDYSINEEDGVRIENNEHWIHLRKSNTEPLIRIIVEARTSGEAEQLIDTYKELILKLASSPNR